jgi:osmotically-inducible protein OsmY
MKQLFVAALVVFLAMPIACSRERESTTQAAREPGRMSDSDLKNKIEARLNSDPQLRDMISVSADADDNRVTLKGTVNSEAMRSKAVEMARAAHPGVTIEDKIDVKPGEATNPNWSDTHRDTDRDATREPVPTR